MSDVRFTVDEAGVNIAPVDADYGEIFQAPSEQSVAVVEQGGLRDIKRGAIGDQMLVAGTAMACHELVSLLEMQLYLMAHPRPLVFGGAEERRALKRAIRAAGKGYPASVSQDLYALVLYVCVMREMMPNCGWPDVDVYVSDLAPWH